MNEKRLKLLKRGYRNLDLAMALNNTKLASSVVNRLIDMLDGKSGVKHYEGKYATLDHEIGHKLTKTPWPELKLHAIGACAYTGYDPISRSLALGAVLGLGQQGGDQMLDFCARIVDPIERYIDATEVVKKVALATPGSDAGRLSILDRELAGEFGTLISDLFRENKIEDKKNIKAVVVYPLIVSTLNTRRQRDPGLSDALIKKVVELEPDVNLRSKIEGMDHQVWPEQKKKN